MEDRTCFKTLSGAQITANMNEDQCRVLADIGKARILDDDEILIEEGRVDNSFHLIAEGKLAVTKDTGGGDWLTLHVLRQGDLAGEMGFIDGRPHSATLRAVGETTVYSFSRESLEANLETHPWVVYRVMQAIVHAVHDILGRMNNQYVEMTNYITKQHGRY